MDIQKINSDIATIEKNLNNPVITEPMKEKLKEKLNSLKAKLQEGAKQAEDAAEKSEDAADSEKKSLEKVISTIRKGLDNKMVPDSAKPALRKKLEEAEAKMAAIEKAAKEAEATAKEVKAEVKEAVAQVTEVIADVKKGNKVKKNAISKVKGAAKKVVTEGKKRKTVATAHEKKFKDIIDELVAHVKANKKLSVVYGGASRDSLERDAARHALPPGRRVSKEGNIYYENRRNRVDVTKRKRYPFFDDGGVLQEIPNNYKGMTAQQVWESWSPQQAMHFMEDHLDLIDESGDMDLNDISEVCNSNSYAEALNVLESKDVDKDDFINTLESHVLGGQYKSGGKIKQGSPQGEHYTEGADAQRGAKPVGYRFTEAFVNSRTGKRLKLTSNSKPTKEQIEKYKGKGVYEEARADHSDKNKRTMLEDGGPIGSGKNTYVAFYKGKEIDVKADTSYAAQQTAAQHFKAKKSYEVNVVLGMLGDKEVVHSTASLAKGGKVKGKKQAAPQGEHYTEEADAQRHAKPVGWRFTNKFLKSTAAKSRGLTSKTRPTKADIAKYKGKVYPTGEQYIYQEARADHSDKKQRAGL